MIRPTQINEIIQKLLNGGHTYLKERVSLVEYIDDLEYNITLLKTEQNLHDKSLD